MRAAVNQPSVATSVSSNGPSKQKPDTISSTLAFSSAVINTSPATALHGVAVKKPMLNDEGQDLFSKSRLDSLKPLRQHIGVGNRNTAEILTPPNEDHAASLSSQSSSSPLDDEEFIPPKAINSVDSSEHSRVSSPDKDIIATDVKVQNLCSDLSAVNIDRNIKNENSGAFGPRNVLHDNGLINMPRIQGLQNYCDDQSLDSTAAGKSVTSTNELFVSREKLDLRADSQTQVGTDASSQEEDDVLSFDSQRLKDPEVVCNSSYLTNSANSFHIPNLSRSHSLQHSDGFVSLNLNSDLDNSAIDSLHRHSSSTSVLCNGYSEKLVRKPAGPERSAEHSFMLSNEGKGSHIDGLQSDDDSHAATVTGENNIISNILSMDFDTWDESLALPQNLVQLLGENDLEPSSMKTSSSRKVQNNNQSRFSFARQEESRNQAFDIEHSFSAFGHLQKQHSFNQDFVDNRDPLEKLRNRNGFYPGSFEESDNFSSHPSVLTSNKNSG